MINDEKINNLNNKGNKMTKEAIQLEEKRTYYEAVNNLLENIKIDYAKWTTWEEGIERFNNLDKEKEISLFHLNNKFISNELKNLSQKVFA